MRTATVAASLFAAIAVASDVHDLKKDTFDSFIAENDLVLAEFFAPWCGHCKALAPEYEEAATVLKDKKIPLAKVDCTEETDLCSKYGVEGYPTLKVFRGPDSISSYSGARKAQAIVSYMTKQSLPAVSILNAKNIGDFKTADKVVLVAYIDKDDKASNETFTSVAESLRDEYLFGAVHDADVAKADGVKAPAVVLYKSFDEGKNIFTDKLDKVALEKWAKTSATPLIGEVGPETYAGYMAAGIPLAYIFAEDADDRETLAVELKSIAEKHKGKLNFATIDAKSFGQHAANLNLEPGKWPAFAIQDTVKNQKFPFDQDEKITKKAIASFVDKFVAGKIEPSVKSEPIPEKQEGPVTVVVAKSYDQIVRDDKKDVFIEFYAPWCGHCKALSPKWEQLGELYKGHADKIVIAKVDATVNDVPDEIQGFPTIKLYPAGKKDAPLTYSGAREVAAFVEYLKENASHSIDVKAEAGEKRTAADEDLPKQAPAATKEAEDSVADKVKKVAEAVKGVVMDEEEPHDEL